MSNTYTDIILDPKAEIRPAELLNNGGLRESATQEMLRAMKDGKKAWIVCVASFLIQVWVVGFLHTFGVFFVAFLDDFEATKAEAAWVGSAAYGLAMALAPIASTLINRFGHRKVASSGSLICGIALISSSFVSNVYQLYGTFTFLFAFGCSLAYTPCMTIASDYFDKYITLATGIMTSGTSIGTLVLSPIAQALVSSYGWRAAFRFFGCTCFIGVFCGMLFKPLVLRPKSSVQRIKTSIVRDRIKDLQLWKNKVYIIWICSIFCVMFGYYIPYVHLMYYADEVGISRALGSVLMMTLGAATAVGRLIFGKLLAKGFIDRLRMDQLSMVITSTAVMMLPLCRTFASVMAYVIIVGLVDGCYVVLLPTLTEAFTSEDNKVTAWGFLNFFCSISFTLGPPVAGWLCDAGGSYNMAFHIAGIPIMVGAVLLFFIPWAQKTSGGTNVMAAAQSYNVIDPDSPRADRGEDVDITLKTTPITIPQIIPASNGTEMITITSPWGHSGDATIRSRGSFVFVDLAKERVMAYSHTLNEDVTSSFTDEHLPGVLTKAMDVLQRESGSVMSLERTHNSQNHGWSVEKFSIASPNSTHVTSRLASTAISPLSNEGSVYPTVSQLGRVRQISVNSTSSAFTNPLTSGATSHTGLSQDNQGQTLVEQAVATTGRVRQISVNSGNSAYTNPLTSGANSNTALPTDNQGPVLLEPPLTSVAQPSLVDLSIPKETVTSNPATANKFVTGSPPTNLFHPISSNPSLPPISEVASTREFRNTVEGGDNPHTPSRPTSPPDERQEAMFQMSDLSLTNFEFEADENNNQD